MEKQQHEHKTIIDVLNDKEMSFGELQEETGVLKSIYPSTFLLWFPTEF